MSELQKELDKDKAFINKVQERIYCESGDWEDSIAEPEWIMQMTDIADKYLSWFKAAENGRRQVAQDKAKLIAMSKPKLNENQEISLWAMQNRFKWYARDIESGLLEYLTTVSDEVYLSNKEFAEVLQAFANWALDQC